MQTENDRSAAAPWHAETACTAFVGSRRVAAGALGQVATEVKAIAGVKDGSAAILIFDDHTSQQIEVDFRGSKKDVLRQFPVAPHELQASLSHDSSSGAATRGPGRPKLGVVAREVTLLPRHWAWLATQPGGASVSLRKLVEEARRASVGRDRIRQAQEATYRFMSAMAGNEPGFEEAARALFAGKIKRFEKQMKAWPTDVRAHAMKLAVNAFEQTKSGEVTHPC